MDVKVTGNYSVYKKMMNLTKDSARNTQVSQPASPKVRSDEIHISGDGIKKQEAAAFSKLLAGQMERGASPERLEALRSQVRNGSYEISAQELAKKMMSGM